MLISSRDIEEQKRYSDFKTEQGYGNFRGLMDFINDIDDLMRENESLKEKVYRLQKQVEHYRNAYNDLAAIGQQGCFDILNTLLSDDCKNHFSVDK